MSIQFAQLAAFNPPAVSGGGGAAPFSDSTALVKGAVDATKLFRVNASTLATATTRTVTPPASDGQLITAAEAALNLAAGLAALNDVIYTSRSAAQTDDTHNVAANTLSANDKGVSIEATGLSPGASNPRLRVGGTTILTAAGLEAPGKWKLTATIMRTSATSVDVSAQFTSEGIDADVGSTGETFTEPLTTVAVADLSLNTLAVVVDHASTADPTRRVNTLIIRKIGGGSGGGGGGTTTGVETLLCWVEGGLFSVPNGGDAIPYAFNSADIYDPEGCHDPAVDSHKITVPRTGKYRFICNTSWATNSTGYRRSILTKNETDQYGHATAENISPLNFAPQGQVIDFAINLNAGDYICLGGIGAGGLAQSSGGALNVTAAMRVYEMQGV